MTFLKCPYLSAMPAPTGPPPCSATSPLNSSGRVAKAHLIKTKTSWQRSGESAHPAGSEDKTPRASSLAKAGCSRKARMFLKISFVSIRP
jgi:hypothetical protein